MVVHHHSDYLNPLSNTLSVILFPVQWVADLPFNSFNQATHYIQTFNQLANENQTLKNQLFLQDVRLQKLMTLETENTQLKTVLKFSEHNPEKFCAAEIMRVNANPLLQRVILNKGGKHGVVLGEPVIDTKGVLGEVIKVQPLTSEVILLTDAHYGISVQNLRTGVRGIVAGTGSAKRLELKYVANTSDLKKGDLLVTSGLDGRYPTGYPVGHVSEIIENPNESYVRVEITPSADLDRGRYVLLLEASTEKSS